jgi:hypothetical protein
MAKKPPRSGGRVTPKGTRPVESPKAAPKLPPAVDHRPVAGHDPANSRRVAGHLGPTRAGHHHGQR